MACQLRTTVIGHSAPASLGVRDIKVERAQGSKPSGDRGCWPSERFRNEESHRFALVLDEVPHGFLDIGFQPSASGQIVAPVHGSRLIAVKMPAVACEGNDIPQAPLPCGRGSA